MSILDAIQVNLLSPAVLFFALGLIAALTNSDLKFPDVSIQYRPGNPGLFHSRPLALLLKD